LRSIAPTNPLLLPVGMPAQPAAVVHPLCVGDANESYNRARQEFEKRERLSNIYSQSAGDDIQEERQAKAQGADDVYLLRCEPGVQGRILGFPGLPAQCFQKPVEGLICPR